MSNRSASEESCDSPTPEASPSPPTGPRPSSPATPNSAPSPSSTTPPSASTHYRPQPATPQIQEIPIDLISLETPNNGRAQINQEAVNDLAALIATHGLINAITVYRDGPHYVLIAGQTRLLAFQQLGRETIPATIRKVTASEAAMLRLLENVARHQLTTVEEAMQLSEALEKRGGGTDELAKATGHSVRWVEDRLDLLSYDAELIAHMHNGVISLAAAKHLQKIQSDTTRQELITQAALHGITAATAAQWLQHTRAAAGPLDPTTENVRERELSTFTTTTTTNCFVCRKDVDLTQTHRARVCDTCINELTRGSSEPAPNRPTPTTTQTPLAATSPADQPNINPP